MKIWKRKSKKLSENLNHEKLRGDELNIHCIKYGTRNIYIYIEVRKPNSKISTTSPRAKK